MRRDSRLSGVLHVLLHMAEHPDSMTSEMLARAMGTNPVVIRRLMAGLRERGFVQSEKGHGGGWTIATSGSAAGTFDSSVPTAANAVNEDDAIEFINSGASDTTCAAVFFADIRKQ